MSGDLTHVTFSGAHYDGGAPVTRADAVRAATEQLAELVAADPTISGGTLVLPDGERVSLPALAAGSRAQ